MRRIYAPISHILRTRQRRRARSNSSPSRRLALGCSVAISLLIALAGLYTALAYNSLTRDLPSLDSLPALLDSPHGLLLQPTRLVDRGGQRTLLVLQNPEAAGKNYLFLPQDKEEVGENIFPSTLISATLAVADPDFGLGISLQSRVLSLFSNRKGLAQRLVSDLLLWNEPAGLQRDLRERLLADRITARFGSDTILTWYLNSADYGRLAYGADAAARVYFGKPASQLNLAEAAMLAGVSQTPDLNPQDAPQLAREHQLEVLKAMLNLGWITPDQADEAVKSALSLRPLLPAIKSEAPLFTALVLQDLSDRVDLKRLARGGLTVITTLDSSLQSQAVCVRQAVLNPSLAAADCPARRYIDQRLLPQAGQKDGPLYGLEASLVVLDPQTGQILALAGSSTEDQQTGSAYLQPHPLGSLLTPFIYLTAFAHGFGPASLVWDIPIAEGLVQPEYHGPVRLRIAFANDYLNPALQLFNQMGPENVLLNARQLGLLSLEMPSKDPAASLLSGNSGMVNLLEASRAFGVFANQGILAGRGQVAGSAPLQPVSVLRVDQAPGDSSPGQVWLDSSSWIQKRPVITPQLAYLVTNILSDETARQASLGRPNPLEIGRPSAVKIGSTEDGSQGWTIGYTPNLVAGVWAGHPQSGSSIDGTANPPAQQVAAALWHTILEYADQDLPTQGWSIPPGINHLQVCDPSGLLPTADCPNLVSEIFPEGSEPTQADTLYRRVEVNRETGRLATIFTPEQLVEKKVFLAVPPEATGWARQSGLPEPPSTYDTISGPQSTSPLVQIASPALFGPVRGKVEIFGKAGGEGFALYRLQSGKGLNPREWLKIGQDSSNPVSDGLLGVWDTTGLSGLYTLELLVIRADQHVDTAIVAVTVDNQAPQITGLYPRDGQSLPAAKDSGIITLRADVQDDQSFGSVTFYVDGKQITRQVQAPYAFPWQSSPGSHTLRIVAADQAGNQSEASAKFEVKK